MSRCNCHLADCVICNEDAGNAWMDYEEDGYTLTCWQCGGEGFSYHECGEDTCCCLNPSDNVVCDICEGKGGWPRPAPEPKP